MIDIAALLTMPSAIAGVTAGGMHGGAVKSPTKYAQICCPPPPVARKASEPLARQTADPERVRPHARRLQSVVQADVAAARWESGR